jgi:glycosyltransferase involved in cell wall biosynthesis
MRIVHVIIDLTSGGAELMLKRLAVAQADSRYEHQVISLRSQATVGPMLQEAGIRVDALGMRSSRDMPRVVAQLVRELKIRRPDIVQTWMYHSDLLGGIAARIAGVPHLIWGVRIADINPKMGISGSTAWVRRACARLCSRLPERVVYVAHSARQVHERLGYDASKGVVIPNGYVLSDVPPRGRLRAELGLGAEALIVGSAGRFSAQKDPQSFVAAASELAARHPHMRFVMIGRNYTHDNAELVGWIAAGGHGDRFYLMGERHDLDACLADMDIFCLHSIGEGFPNVVAEAMSVGTPCVVTDVGDAAFLIDDTGTAVPPSQPDALAAAIEAMASLHPERRRELGAAARERVARHFSIEAVSRQYETLYDSILAPSAHARQADAAAAVSSN